MDSASVDSTAVALLVEGSSTNVGQSPVKPRISLSQVECFSPKVATPLRGCKRALSNASLAQHDGPAKVRLIATSPIAFSASPSTDLQKQLPTSGTECNKEPPLPLHVAYLRRRLEDVRREFETPGRVDQGWVNEVRRVHANLGSLEAYKKELDSSTKWGACDDHTGANVEDAYIHNHCILAETGEAEHENHAELTDADWSMNEDVELQGTATVSMDYSRWANEDEQACCSDSHDAFAASAPLQITIGYQDEETGVMMCYRLCDDHDEDVQAMRAICGEEAEQLADNEGSDCENSDSKSSTAEESPSHSSRDMQGVDEQHLDTAWQGNCVWQDESSGTILAYAVCDDETEEEAIMLGAISHEALTKSTIFQHDSEEAIGAAASLQITLAYPDAATGVMMCYQLCDDSDEELQAVRGMCEETESEFTEEDKGSDRESSDSQSSSEEESFSHSDGEEYLTRLNHQDSTWQGNYEWKDQTSGTIFAYAVCDDEIEEEARQLGVVLHGSENNSMMVQHESEEDIGVAAPMQITIGYQDAGTGAMMCYQLCDDSDEDLQAVRAMCEEEAELTEDDEGCEQESSENQSSSEEEPSSQSALGDIIH